MRRLVDEDPEAVSKRDNNGATPLHLVCYSLRESENVVQVLLDRCPTLVFCMRNYVGFTPLLVACYSTGACL
jgi:ankyrin repeat protein